SYAWSNSDSTQTSTVNTTGLYSVLVSDSSGCTNSDTVMVTINTPPVAALALPFSTVCVGDGVYTLSGGSPAGGTYSGTGVSGSLFSPATAGVGTHTIMYMVTDSAGCSDTTSQVVTVNTCVGIQDVSAGSQVSVYPNPSTGLFTFELRDATSTAVTLTVLDSRGRSLLEKQVNAASAELRTTLDLGSFDNGFYFLVVQSGDASKTVKLVVNR
ncbi:MAG: hypothetical protein FD123_2958, partial [Bacteroidetes bacterium]